MKYSIACCFLTHNHTDVLKDILDKSLKDYNTHQIDVCIYDDSDDDSTKQLINEYEKEFDNIYYIDAHEALNGDHKYLLILQGYRLPKDYDYIWMCKDRVCFASSYLDRLCEAINEGHDVIIGGNERQRWDVGINVNKDIYVDPALFYKNYAVFSTNWEALIRKRATMLKDIDWEYYKNTYHIDENSNSFNQTISLFVRLSELERVSIRICRYEFDERYISSKASSNWKNILFSLWIDQWVAANFSLPEIYDKYKAEAIKSETNLKELFGSTEQMIEWHSQGIYTNAIFQKYKSIWPFVTEIPLNCLELISNGQYKEAMLLTLNDFEQAFPAHDFQKGWWLISANQWFKQVYDETTYTALVSFFNYYRNNMIQTGTSSIFDGINSIQDVVEKYKTLTQ